MKKPVGVVAAVVFSLALAGTAEALPVYVGTVTAASGWSDVNKASVNGAPDSFLCWAAAASDALAYAGWRGWDPGTSSYIDTAAGIYAEFVAGWANTIGAPTYAYEWWMTDRTQSIIDPPGPETPKLFPSAGLDFYPTVNVQEGAGSVTAFVGDDVAGDIYTWLGNYIAANRGIVASILVPSGPGLQGPYSHSLTVWGWDDVANLIYITDSDDGLSALRTYSFYQSGGQVYIDNYSNLYTNATDVQITQLTRLNVNDTGIEPAHDVASVPEPSTLVLLGLGLAGMARAARRKK